ncbi:MAG: sensor histidine kinase [Bacteroidales bacterium]|jgi:signal transduction histidine kinase|nr:sensor histidine kinase [Bacteroidales bacterium]
MNIKRKVLIVLALLMALLSSCHKAEQVPSATKGVITLNKLHDRNRFIVRLNGEWEFYWLKMLRPNDFSSGSVPKPDIFGKVPSYWTDYHATGLNTEKHGFATYRLRVILPPGFRDPLGFDMPVFDSSYDLYVNGEYTGGNGTPGKTAATTIPGYRKNLFKVVPASDTLDIIINVSNFHHRRGGFWLPLKMGNYDLTEKRKYASWASDWATISLLIGFSLFFMFFFIIYPKDKIIGFFSLATTGLALRPLFTSNFLILDMANPAWEWIIRFEYIGLYIIIAGWYWFASHLYPSKVIRLAAKTLTWIFALAFILTLVLPVNIFSNATFVFYPSLLLLLGYAIYKSVEGAIKMEMVDIFYLAAFILLLIGAVHDILVAMGRSQSSVGYVMTVVVVIFVFIQASLLLYKWVQSFSEKEKLHQDLEYLNRNLGRMVDERTKELRMRSEEIERQNSRIALQNRQLSETIRLKNKIFSVIAHDLRSPVVNILYMLNLLKEEEYKAKYDEFANSSIQYAQQVISLLENMLVWGRGQQDKIKYSPEKHNLADIILTNLSIFKESADSKEVAVNFTQMGNSMAYADRDLLDIIIRNLLSNAIKYTPRGGRISILLKDKSYTGEGVLIKVCDNGMGISEEKQKELFSSKEITSTPGTENERGTGLGLKLCQELVKINGGKLSIESREGEGTCLSIMLPNNQ